MAISRSLMNRQLQANGGIMQVAPREKFGLGSKLKKFARKIIPNEVAEIAVKAAPFVAPFNPALAGAMAGIGSFDQTGSLSGALKSGALTYGGGQAARFIGGAGFQGNPFEGGLQGTLQNFSSFSSPIGTETGLGKFFSNRGTEGVQGINVDSGRAGDSASALSRSSANAPGAEALASEVSYVPEAGIDIATGGADGVGIISDTLMDPAGAAGKSRALGDTILKTTVDKSVVTKEPGFLKNIFDGVANQDYQKVAKTIGDGAKKFGKAMFTNKDGSIDKAAVLGAVAFASSYAEAKALAADAGVELTEEEYDEATKEEKKAEYASYLTNFFGGRKDGGRIGFKKGSPEEPSEIGIMTIDVEAGDDEDQEDIDDLMAGITFSSAEKSYLFKRLGATGGSGRSSSMPNLYRILSNPSAYPSDAAVLKQIAIMGMNKKDGGRIGFAGGSNRVSELLVLRDSMLAKDADADVSDIDAEIFQLTGKVFNSVGGLSEIPTGKIRKNDAGVVERDYRDEGGFVPVGIKERADDVPAMLSKNEFVMTADAVRGIGGGDVEKGSKRLYNTMKQAEKVGRA